MAGAHRNKKLSTYNVKVTRSIHWEAVIKVNARSAEEAEGLAVEQADNPMDDSATQWESDADEMVAKAKLVRGT